MLHLVCRVRTEIQMLTVFCFQIWGQKSPLLAQRYADINQFACNEISILSDFTWPYCLHCWRTIMPCCHPLLKPVPTDPITSEQAEAWAFPTSALTCVSRDHLWSDPTPPLCMQINTHISIRKDGTALVFLFTCGRQQRTKPASKQLEKLRRKKKVGEDLSGQIQTALSCRDVWGICCISLRRRLVRLRGENEKQKDSWKRPFVSAPRGHLTQFDNYIIPTIQCHIISLHPGNFPCWVIKWDRELKFQKPKNEFGVVFLAKV